MYITIRYNNRCPVKLNQREKFEEFIRKIAIFKFKKLLEDNIIYIDNILKPLQINCRDIDSNLEQLIKVKRYLEGFRISLSSEVFVNNIRLTTVIRAFDFGSTITGLPKPMFYPTLLGIKRRILSYYITFLRINI